MKIDDVIALSKAGVSDSLIIGMMDATDSWFQLKTQDVIDLRNAGVSRKGYFSHDAAAGPVIRQDERCERDTVLRLSAGLLGGGMMDFIPIGIIHILSFVWDIDRIIPDFLILGISVDDPDINRVSPFISMRWSQWGLVSSARAEKPHRDRSFSFHGLQLIIALLWYKQIVNFTAGTDPRESVLLMV